MDVRRAVELMFTRHEKAETPNGSFRCIYAEEYEQSLDQQGVVRSITFPRHVADDLGINVGSTITRILTVDNRVVGPFTVETFEPQQAPIVVMRLRSPEA